MSSSRVVDSTILSGSVTTQTITATTGNIIVDVQRHPYSAPETELHGITYDSTASSATLKWKINGPARAGISYSTKVTVVEIPNPLGSTGLFDITNYGADPTGVSNSASALSSAWTAAVAAGNGVVFIPKGNFLLSTAVSLTGDASIMGLGIGSNLQAGHVSTPILQVNSSDGSFFKDFKITGSASVRDSGNYGFYAVDGTRLEIHGLDVSAVAAGGIVLSNCADSQVCHNSVYSNYADGIHLTGGSKRCSVTANDCRNTGDDAIALVSYDVDAAQMFDCTVVGNTISDSKSRGIVQAGCRGATITGNNINGTASNGIMSYEDGTFNTRTPENTVISGNTIRNTGSVSPNLGNQDGIYIADGIGFVISNNVIEDGSVAGMCGLRIAKQAIVKNNYVRAYETGAILSSAATSTVFEGNRIESTTKYGVYVDGADYSTFSNNFTNNCNTSATANIDAYTFLNVEHVNIIGNTNRDTVPNVRYGFAFATVDDITDIGNRSHGHTAGAFLWLTSTNIHTILTGSNIFEAYDSVNGKQALHVDANRNVVVGEAAALATNATDGFLYIPRCAGTPTGTPTSKTGKVAFVYDSTNDKLYVYDTDASAWKGTAALT